jgi:hypothetical protein
VDEKTPGRYSPEKAFDGDLSTSWVEGVEGDGIGQRIAFLVPAGARVLWIVPGYGDAKIFKLNNRVRSARLSYYELTNKAAGQNNDYSEIKERGSVELSFQDVLKAQEFPITPPAIPQGFQKVSILGVLEILSVYPGTRWKDTCIAEIQAR